MIRHSETSVETTLQNTATPSASPEILNVPFTAQEIADAIAAVEKDRRDEAARESETAQIAHVLDQLGLDLPAQTIAERVRENRAMRDEQTLANKSMRDGKLGLLWGLVGGLFLVGLFVSTVVSSGVDDPVPVRSAKPSAVDPGALLVTNRIGNGTPVIQTFAEAEDSVPVTISAYKLRLLLADSLPDGMRGSVSPSFDPACEWTVLRKNGQYYVRGYVKARMSPAASLAASTIRLYNRRDVGTLRGTETRNSTLTIPVRALRVRRSQTQDSFALTHALDVQLTNVDNATFGE